MFRNLPVFDPDDADLEKLGEKMIQSAEDDKDPNTPDDDENLEIPAGYTYLGQFIDHDITFDPVSSLQRQNDPDALVDFRTPRLDLDNIYGRGPDDQPYLFQSDGIKLALGASVSSDPNFAGPDLPRNNSGRALIGDPRNDENKIVSQLQSVFLRFHNAIVDRAAETKLGNGALLKEAQRRVRWHYQWVVVHDFLPRILGGKDLRKGEQIIQDILRPVEYVGGIADGKVVKSTIVDPNFKFYHWRDQPFMPVEFSVAAYRFGHSMVRPRYFFNDKVRQPKNIAAFGRTPIFSKESDPPTSNMNSFQPLPTDWGFQWKYFFELGGSAPNVDKLPQPSYKIDTELATPLGALPSPIILQSDPIRSLALRNLKRGKALGLPSGQNIARAMGIDPLTDDVLELSKLGLRGSSIDGNAPLWFYVLKEAETLGGSAHLGPVGGRIVAEVLLGLLWGDPLSYIRVQPNWKPDPSLVDRDEKFGMAQLVKFALGQK